MSKKFALHSETGNVGKAFIGTQADP